MVTDNALEILERINEITGVARVEDSPEFQYDGILMKREVDDLLSISTNPEEFAGILIEKERAAVFIRADDRRFSEALKLFIIHYANGKGGQIKNVSAIHKSRTANMGFYKFENAEDLAVFLRLMTIPDNVEAN